MEVDLNKFHKIHFIGIGGIGLSAIAKLMVMKGKAVSGSDTSLSLVTEKLAKDGVTVYLGHQKSNLGDDVEVVIHTIAIPADNPELICAKERGLVVLTYPQMLGIISAGMKTIAVSGTHGKTTTTAMIAKVLIGAGLDPTVIVGGLMKDVASNLTVGQSDYFIVEACEYRRSFLNLNPTILVITNIEEDHLDYYSDIIDIQSAFRELSLKVPQYGAIICNPSDPHVKPLLEGLKCRIIDYTLCNHSLSLKMPGNHNRLNACAAYSVANFLKIDSQKTTELLKKFTGTWRRFDYKGKTKNGALLYDDYAHHPQEIQATLQGLAEMYPHMNRVVFFQPHLYSRTKFLLKEFSESFELADEVYILPIYAARESFDSSINSPMLAEKIPKNKAFYIETFEQAKLKIDGLEENTVVLIMGAGDVYKIAEMAIK